MDITITIACPKCNHSKYKIIETMVFTPESDKIRDIKVFPNADTTTDLSTKEYIEEQYGRLTNQVRIKTQCLNCHEEHIFILGGSE